MTPETMGPYRIGRLLGRGGMGFVYEGVDEQTGTPAAVKIISVAFADDESFRERFAAEVETLKKLRHPNIVQLYGFGVERGVLFYAMELVPGRNLQEELNAGRRFHWREVSRIGVEVCQALKHAHDRGVIHRDLKPANLLFDEQEHVKLSDFGIAKLFGGVHLTAQQGVVGTVDYMSPEQADGRPVNARSDLYSLGGVLYALLAGRPPFAARSPAQVIHGLRFDEPLPVRRFAPDAPEEFERLIAQLLEKDPQQRTATALAVSNRLKAMEFALSVRPDRPEAELPSDGRRSVQQAGQQPRTVPLDSDSGARPTALSAGAARAVLGDAPTQPDQAAPVADSSRLADPGQAAPAGTPGRASAAEPSAKSAKTLSHFTTVDEDERRRAEQLETMARESPAGWLKLALAALALAAIAAAAWRITRRPSADRLYHRIAAAAEQGNASALAQVEDAIELFLELFPKDQRSSEVAQYREEIERYRLQRRFEHRARRLGSTSELTPVETAYLEAIRAEQISPEAGAAKLQALIDVFGGQDDAPEMTRQCLDVARRRLQNLNQSIARASAAHLAVIRRRLERAEELSQTNPSAARAILQGIIDLYGDKPWAADQVQRSRSALQRLPQHPSQPERAALP